MSTTEAPAREAYSFVKVRFYGERQFQFVAPGGRTTSRRLHASTFETRAQAEECARYAVKENDDIAAAAVMQDSRRVYLTGEPTPAAAAPKYGPEAGYALLVDVTPAGWAVIHVKDEHGRWAAFTEEAYEAAYDEQKLAGAKAMAVHATLTHIVPSSNRFRFVQESNPAAAPTAPASTTGNPAALYRAAADAIDADYRRDPYDALDALDADTAVYATVDWTDGRDSIATQLRDLADGHDADEQPAA